MVYIVKLLINQVTLTRRLRVVKQYAFHYLRAA